jgi:hypothetical protein
VSQILELRREQSARGLTLVREGTLSRLPPIVGKEPLAIYATGSFGREEAVFPKGSDLDLFFLYHPKSKAPEAKPASLMFFELAAKLIGLARELEFEDFSGDGEYLQVHNVFYIGEQLGSRHEDAENGFTARLLLLLESQFVFNESLYEAMLEKVVGFYFEDFQANETTFRPTFLLNDIMRFWRTLCLNYEHKRRSKRTPAKTPAQEEKWRAKSALDNFKLRFSRLSTCYSMVAALASESTPVRPERVVELCRTTPSRRWDVAVDNAPSRSRQDAKRLREKMAKRYDFFLEMTADKDRALEQLGDQKQRKLWRSRAHAYGQLVEELVLTTSRADQRRTLIV